nr:putative multiple coagulation factor deficiency protein 2 isoform X1 [Biomphalaria glabrata]
MCMISIAGSNLPNHRPAFKRLQAHINIVFFSSYVVFSDDDSEAEKYSDREIGSIIDSALDSEDLNDDGYVEYAEFMAAQAKRRQARDGFELTDLPGYDDGKPPSPPGSSYFEPRPPGY